MPDISAQPSIVGNDEASSLQFAWNVNSSLHQQTNLADAKSSAIIVFAAALFAALTSFTNSFRAAGHDMPFLPGILAKSAFALFVTSVVLCFVAVFPRFSSDDARGHVSHTGLLAHGSASALIESFKVTDGSQRLSELLKSNHAVALINHSKFRLIRFAIIALLIGTAAFGFVILLSV